MNRHPIALRDNVPVSEDEKHASVILCHPVGLTGLAQGEELKVSRGKNGTVRWSKVVDGKGGKEVCFIRT